MGKPLPGVEYCFTPFVTVSLQEDGSLLVSFDWSDSYVYSQDNYDHRVRKHDWNRHWAEYSEDVGNAMVAWLGQREYSVSIPLPDAE